MKRPPSGVQWSPAQYLRFGAPRTQVVRDLVARVKAELPRGQVRTIVDLGCGPANSTQVLRQAWPRAAIVGLDADSRMLTAARAACPGARFVAGDIVAWAASPRRLRFDLVFSNSALQWIAGHGELAPRLLARVAPGGALAFQVPSDVDVAACRLPREMATTGAWRRHFSRRAVAAWHCHRLSQYYDWLAPQAAAVDVWETEYVQVMASVEAIRDWYLGSGLRPYLAALPDEATRSRFLREYLQGLRAAYTPQPDGRVLFPFRRRFVIARKPVNIRLSPV